MSSPPKDSQWFSKSDRTFVEVVKVENNEITFKSLLDSKVRSQSVEDFLKVNEPLTLDTSLYGGIPKVCSRDNFDSML